MLKIRKLHTPLEPFVIWENGFSDEDIEHIISLGEMAEFAKGTIGTASMGEAVINTEIRDTDIVFIDPSENSHWLYDRIGQLCTQINFDKYQFDLSHFQPFQYGKYKVGGHYKWHYDAGNNLPEHRKLSFVLALSDPDSYEGGELQLNVNGDQEKPHSIKIKKGHLVVFPSFISHRVTPVTSGERITLVAWAVGAKFI